MDTEYIYLLQEREFINSKQPIYKIGKTKQENHKRFGQYPKGSILLFQIICSNCDDYEKKILNLFNHKFKKQPDIGREYFEGDYKKMINYIYNIVYLYDYAGTGYNILSYVDVENENRPIPIVEPIVLLQQIKIKSTICNDHKQYYITNENDELIIDIYNNSHMEWILSGDYAGDETDSDLILIEENVIYNINDKKVIDSIKIYTDIIGEIINYEEHCENVGIETSFNKTDEITYNKNYNYLSFKGKIIFLFMATKLIDSGEYLSNMENQDGNEDMYIFSVNNDVNNDEDKSEDYNDYSHSVYKFEVLNKYFINIGKLKETDDFLKYKIIY